MVRDLRGLSPPAPAFQVPNPTAGIFAPVLRTKWVFGFFIVEKGHNNDLWVYESIRILGEFVKFTQSLQATLK